MKPSLKVGNVAAVEATVTRDMCPAFDEVVVHEVYSTWSMAHHMELAARKVLVDHLEPHEEGIGRRLEIEHVAPTPVGKNIRAVATATEVTAKGVICKVEVFDGDRLVGRGLQEQRVLPKEILQKMIQRHRAVSSNSNNPEALNE